jgi:hypothetical protein
MKKISPQETSELSELYKERSELTLSIAELNSQNEPEEISATAKPDIVYSTNKIAAGRKGAGKSIYRQSLEDVRTEIAKIEGKMLNQNPKNKKDKEKDSWKEVPEYSPEELALRQNCLAYYKDRKNPRPTFSDGKALDEAQILEVVQEAARDEKWPNGNFFEENYKGRRQLSYIEKFGNKRIKYTHLSENLPAGKYFFESDPASFFISKNNANSAIAPVRLMVSGENPKQFLAEKEAKRQKRQTA